MSGSPSDVVPSDEDVADAPTRRCARCLQQFPGDPDADLTVIQELWMCPACRTKLFGEARGAAQ